MPPRIEAQTRYELIDLALDTRGWLRSDNRVTIEDKRTPVQLLDFIATKGQEADAALANLRGLME